jgi:hypothetical protein
MKRAWVLFVILGIGCQSNSRKEEPSQEQNSASPSATETNTPPTIYDYTPLYGVYDHEYATSSFNAVVALKPEGLNLHFTISSAQGSCKAETEGVIAMVEHTDTYFIGFSNIEKCPLQFTFYPTEQKIDIKEVSLCTIHGQTCGFEGMYIKRKDSNE